MPSLPMYDMPQVRQAPLELPKQQLDTTGVYGEAVGQGVQQLGQGIAQMEAGLQQAKDKANEYNVAKGMTAAQAATNDAFYNPKTGYMNLKGEAALAAAGPTLQAIQAKHAEIAQKLLTNDEQRRAFAFHMRDHQVELQKQVEAHAGQQWEQAKEANVEAAKETGLISVVNNYTDAGSVAAAMAPAVAAIRAQALSPQDAVAKVAQLQTRVDSIRLDQYLANKDFKGASNLLAVVKDRLGPVSKQYENRIATLREEQETQSQAQSIVATHTDESGRPIEGAIYQEINKEPPGEKRKLLEQQVQQQLSQQMKAYEQVERDRMGRVVLSIEQSGGNLDRSTDDYMKLSPENKAKAWERRNTILRQDKSEQRALDTEELKRFSALEREDQAKVDINTQFPSASQTARYQMTALQNSVKSKLGNMKLPEFDDQIRSAAEQLKLTKSDAAELKAQLDGWYFQTEHDNNGKPPTRDQVAKEIASRLEHHDGSWFFNAGNKYRFQATPDEDFTKTGPQPYEAITKKAEVPAKAAAVPAKATMPGRVTRTDPKTGETRVWNGQKWVTGG